MMDTFCLCSWQQRSMPFIKKKKKKVYSAKRSEVTLYKACQFTILKRMVRKECTLIYNVLNFFF
jgi:hypothetical protein